MNTYLGLKSIGQHLGVSAATVSKWRARYDGTDTPCPAPAVEIDGVPGWSDLSAWTVWNLSRPGRGIGGGPLPLARARQEYDAAIAAVRDEPSAPTRESRVVMRALNQIAETYDTDSEALIGLANRIADENPGKADDECDVMAVAMVIRAARKSKG